MPHKNPEEARAYKRRYVKANREAIRERNRAFRALHADRLKAERAVNKERRREWFRAWSIKNKDTLKEKKTAWSRAHYALPENRLKRIARRYGMTAEQCRALHEAQHGRCAICNTPGVLGSPGRGGATKGVLVVDHDHATGAVRGLLCGGCNTVIGHAKDSVGVLRNAIRYLTSRRPCEVSA